MKTLSLSIVMLLVFAGCHPSGEQQQESEKKKEAAADPCQQHLRKAMRMDSVLQKETDVRLHVANEAITAFTNFAFYCKGDSLLAPFYLIKAAQVAHSVKNLEQVRIALDACVKEYPKFRDRPVALMMLGQLYQEDSHMHSDQQAIDYYQQLIREYPNSPWAESAKGALMFVGKSDADMMKEFKKKEKASKK